MTLLLATTGLVTAEPVDRESTERYRLTDRPAVTRPAPVADGWVELADPTPTKHGKEFISVGAGAGTFTRIRVDVQTGRLYLQTVRVDFKDGSSKVARIDKLLKRSGKGKRSMFVDLGGAREIKQVVVSTDRAIRGTYTVHASTETPNVATR